MSQPSNRKQKRTADKHRRERLRKIARNKARGPVAPSTVLHDRTVVLFALLRSAGDEGVVVTDEAMKEVTNQLFVLRTKRTETDDGWVVYLEAPAVEQAKAS